MCESLKCLPICWWCVLQVRVICITGFLLCCNMPTDLRIHVLLPSLDIPFRHIGRACQNPYVAVLVAEVVLDAVDVQMVPFTATLIKVSGWRDDLGKMGQCQCEDDLAFACVCPYQVIGRMHGVLEPPQLFAVRTTQLCAVGSGVQITRLFPAILDRTAAGFFRFAKSEVHGGVNLIFDGGAPQFRQLKYPKDTDPQYSHWKSFGSLFFLLIRSSTLDAHKAASCSIQSLRSPMA